MTKLYARPGQLLENHLTKVSELAMLFGEKFGLTEMLRVAGLLHDYGKTQPAFQEYMFDESAKRGKVVHSVFGAVKAYGAAGPCAPVAEMLGNMIAAHHGSLYDFISPDGDTPQRDVLEKEKPLEIDFKPLEDSLDLDVQKLRNEFQNIYDSMAKDEKAFGLSMLTKLAYSCLVDADRLDAFLFENQRGYEPTKPDWDGMLVNLSLRLAAFDNAPESEMARLRRLVSDGCGNAGKRNKGIYKLEVPTGGGKTLASLRFALEHAKRHGMDRIIYVIPYLSILSQTAKEIRSTLGADEFTVLEHHSGFLSDAPENYKLHTDRWDAPVILTTQVQFLESVFSAKGSDLRKLHNMANSVFIFDEAQSLPIKCVYLFNGAVNFLKSVCGSTILLCTATQPKLDEVPHPVLIDKTNSSLVDCGPAPKRTVIKNCLSPGGYSYPELAGFVLEKHSSSTLVIVNTKAAAKGLYDELKNSGARVLHLSTNMCSAHRDAVIEELKDRLKKFKPGEPVDISGSVICISTQLIEAGVDISLECVIRDLAGLDSIYQAAGRCNRHGEFGEAKPVYVVNIEGEVLDKLPDIKTGAEITRKLFNAGSPDDIDEYYRLFFFERESFMGFPTDGGSIYSWLTDNAKGVHNYHGEKPKPVLRSAIRSAGDAFYVIDRGRTDVVVPYGEYFDLLTEYAKAHDAADKRRLLQKLGKYGVSLYKYQMDALYDAGAVYSQDGLLIMSEGFYNEDRGVDLNGRHEFLLM